ncbi:MAG TPA: hypothetical protein VGG39_25960 [Polyangiaceae bacterium]|jgi:hypothetical protein
MPLTKRAARASGRAWGLSLAAGVSLAACMAFAPPARADDKEVCIRAVDRAQVARLDGKLREAREGFVTCARAVCPDAIRTDCTRWVTEVDASLPSVVFDAVWADGRDVDGLTVLVDGKPVTGAEKGRAVTLDPGEHAFRLEIPGAVPVEMHHLIREGEHNRILHVTFVPLAGAPGAAPESAPAPAPASAPAPAPALASAPPNLFQPLPPEHASPAIHRSIPLASFVLGGIALGALAGFATLGLTGTSRLDSMRSTCVHTCNPADVSSARTEILAGDIIGFVGLAAAGAAAWIALAR